MATGAYKGNFQVIGTIGQTMGLVKLTATGTNKEGASVVAPVALSGTLSTRTDDTIGIATSEAHGLAGTEVLAIFWTDPDDGTTKCAYDCEITDGTSVGEDTIGFTASAGDALPVEDTVIQIAVAQIVDENVQIPGDTELLGLLITSTKTGHVNLLDDAGTGTATVLLAAPVAPTSAYVWPKESGEDEPFDDTVAEIRFYNASILATATMTVTALLE